MLKTITFFLLFYACTISQAAEVEISGLLLDNTISRQGHEFARQFSTLWREVPKTQGLNVQIIEQVVPRAGTRLLINIKNRTVYITHMGRRQSSIKTKVEQAILTVINAIAQLDNQLNSPDMASNGW